MTIATARTGIATALNTLTGLRAYAYEPDSVETSPAAAWVVPAEAVTADFEHNSNLLMHVVVVTGPRSEIQRAQVALDALIEEGAIPAKLTGTLSGAVQDIAFVRWTAYGPIALGAIDYIGVIFEFEVYL